MTASIPEQFRPKSWSEVVGQEKIVAYLQSLAGRYPSLLLYGPPGSGKTTIARVLAADSGLPIKTLSAVSDGLPALRKILEQSQEQPLLLFVDEIHRWNKAQQDALLPFVERGDITLIGATTESPGHEINAALRSRLQLLTLQPLTAQQISELLSAAGQRFAFQLTDEAREAVISHAGGDARRALLLVDRARALAGAEQPAAGAENAQQFLDLAAISAAAGQRLANYGRHGERDQVVSAWIKALRASDREAALYWLARMEQGGEDPRFLARRMIIFASEDIGLADRQALPLATSVAAAVQQAGEPECWINLAHGSSYLAQAAKSWSSYRSWRQAQQVVASERLYPPPAAAERSNYRHPADDPQTDQRFLPDELRDQIWIDIEERRSPDVDF